MAKITVKDTEVTVIKVQNEDYICITDMAKAKGNEARAADIIKNWIRNRSTLEFLGTWEMMYNPDFKVVEFDHFKMEAGLHTFVLSTNMWIEKTNAIKQTLIPSELTMVQASMIYASEADVLNVAMFGVTAKEWRDQHPDY